MLSLRLRGLLRLRFRLVFRLISLAIAWLTPHHPLFFRGMFFHPKERLILYLTSSSLETRIVGYSNEPPALLPGFWVAFHTSHSVSCFSFIFPNLFSWSTTYLALKIFHIFSPKPKKLKVNKSSLCFSKFFRSVCVLLACFFKHSYRFFPLLCEKRSFFFKQRSVSKAWKAYFWIGKYQNLFFTLILA